MGTFDLDALANGPHLAGNPAFKKGRVRAAVPGKKRREPIPSGHAAPVGSGPPGETCRTCAHLTRKENAKVYLKCGANRGCWTGGRKSDVRAGDAACSKWEKLNG